MTDGPTGKFDRKNGELRDFTPSSSHQAVHLDPDTILFDKFRVIKLLGRGGMGSVYQVQHLHLRTEYALKCLNRQQQNDASWRRFENEARASNKLDHPNLIKVHDSGLLPDGQPYFVMDLVNGATLADEIKKTGRLPVHVVLKLFIQVGFALSYAHEHGVIHRDIKPTNIMLVNNKDGTLSNSVKVVDFGIAKLTGQDEFNQQTLTRTGEIFGSPLYMSPEQCMGVAVDHRSDLYSLGCVMYEALTGAPPFVGDNALSTMMKHQTEKPLSLKQASMGIEFPDQLEMLVQRLLEKDPKNRYSNASLLTADLVALEQNLHTGVTMSLNIEDIRNATAQSKKKGMFSDSKSTAVTLLILLSVYGLGIATGMYVSQKKAETPREIVQLDDKPIYLSAPPKITQKGRPVLDNKSIQDAENLRINFTAKYFSDSQGDVRVFHFPKDISLGVIEPTYPKGEIEPSEMKGDVTLMLPVTISVNDAFLNNAHLMSKFRDDEIACLRFRACERPVGPLFSRMTRMYKVIDIDLGDSMTGPKDLKYLEKIPNLIKLSFSKSNITCDDVIHFKKLPDLCRLGLCEMRNVKPLLKELWKVKTLIRLDVGRCNLDVDDLKTISELKHLNYVDLTANKCVNDKTLKVFLNTKTIDGFDLEKCNITRASIPTFQGMRLLNTLRITDPEWKHGPDGFQAQFKQALPHVNFEWQGAFRDLPEFSDP